MNCQTARRSAHLPNRAASVGIGRSAHRTPDKHARQTWHDAKAHMTQALLSSVRKVCVIVLLCIVNRNLVPVRAVCSLIP